MTTRQSSYVSNWDCWAPNCSGTRAWQDWEDGKTQPQGYDQPTLKNVKPILRRRLSTLARGAFLVGSNCLGESTNTATVFASCNGQLTQSNKLLEDLACDAALSPAAFSLSVHNGIAGLFTMAFGLKNTSLTLAVGREGIGAPLLEAIALLTEPQIDDVLLVLFDDALDPVNKPIEPFLTHPIAMAINFTKKKTQHQISIAKRNAPPQPTSTTLGLGEQMRGVINFLTRRSPKFALIGDNILWDLERSHEG